MTRVKTIVYLQPRTHRAGAQKSLLRLARMMGDYQIILVCGTDGWLASEFRSLGAVVLIERYPSYRSLVARLFNNKQFASRVAKRLQRMGVDKSAVVHANDVYVAPFASMLGRSLGARSVLTIRSAVFSMRDWGRYRCADVDRVYAVGKHHADEILTALGDGAVDFVPNGIADDEFFDIKVAVNVRRLGVVGSFRPVKGWNDLIAALSLIDGALKSELELVFIGSNDGFESAEVVCAKAGVRQVVFTGEVDNFSGEVRKCDLIIHPSRAESFGMAALEVLSAGVPMISSKVGVVPKIIQESEDLFEPEDIDGLAGCLRSKLSSWNSRVGAEVASFLQAEVKQRYSIRNTAMMVSEIYERF